MVVGFCAEDANAGVNELKGWVSALSLKRGRLHGMDIDGVPRDMSDFGPVYIRYVSTSGDAYLSGYDGNYRGAYFTPQLSDGEFRQYGVLPIGLWKEDAKLAKESSSDNSELELNPAGTQTSASSVPASSLSLNGSDDAEFQVRISSHIDREIQPRAKSLEIRLKLLSVDALSGSVVVCCQGDEAVVNSEAVKRWIKSSFSTVSGVQKVVIDSVASTVA
mmetsp:Transcript_14077/g.19553  ORF Transcript_14077/g.19553 Transcript_14077/m.19553 type:complete len:219 (+) Transcript_14077:53-709(+)